MKSKRGEVKREVSFSGKKLYSREGANDKKLLDSFYNKSLANLMRLDQSSFEESEESILSQTVGLDDMVDMERMEEELVLQNLKDRYQSKIIYTYTGGILVALNPFENLNIYNTQHVKLFMGKDSSAQPPHIFSIAERAYTNMKNNFKDQSILICGESGAGKTESTKLILQYLVDRTGISNKNECSIESRMLESIPILEALGNAKTANNNNSSRFGKFIQVEFNKHFAICGSKIKAYLLEKSRVAHQPPGERNFHIFYQMTEGCTPEFRKRYHVQRATDYNFLKNTVIQLEGVDERESFLHFNVALRLFGIPDVMIDNLFRILSGLLYLGNLNFTEATPVQLLDNAECREALQLASELLGIAEGELLHSVTHVKLQMRTETIEKPLTREQSLAVTYTFAQGLYSQLFHWLVSVINETTYSSSTSKNYIGILDIFGFENFETNSYEQFLINYANEKFQQLQNHYIFDIEQREYVSEGLEWETISSTDNQSILSLIETPPLSILSLLREGSRFPSGSDNLVRNLHKQFEKLPIYRVPPINSDNQFQLQHYPGWVTYTVDHWVDKDHDHLPPHIHEIIESRCSNKLISLMFTSSGSQSAPPGVGVQNHSTLSNKFKLQLKELMDVIHRTNPLFVRCIKPNNDRRARCFDDSLTMAQLRCTGMLNCIQIRKLGYPVRYKFDEFLSRYSLLFNERSQLPFALLQSKKHSPKKNCKKLVGKIKKQFPKLPVQSIVLGKSKVLMKTKVATTLDHLRGELLQNFVVDMQCWWRMVCARVRLHSRVTSVVLFQRVYRSMRARRAFLEKRDAVYLLQRVARTFLAQQQRRRRLKEEMAKAEQLRRDEQERLAKEQRELELEKRREMERIKNEEERIRNEEKQRQAEEHALAFKSPRSSVGWKKDTDSDPGHESPIESPKRRRKLKRQTSSSSRRSRRIKKEQLPLQGRSMADLDLDTVPSPKQSKNKSSPRKLTKRKSKRKLSRINGGDDVCQTPEAKKEGTDKKKRRRSKSTKSRFDFAYETKLPELPLDTKQLLIGTNWDLHETIDIDSCCMFFEYEKFVDVVWQFNNISKDRAAQFLGFPQWLPKEQQLDREQIVVSLSQLSPNISTIIVALVIFSPSTSWSAVRESSLRMLCTSTDADRPAQSDWEHWGRLRTAPSTHADENSAKLFVKLTRSGFTWVVSPIDVNIPARTYKAILPHLGYLLDEAPPVRTMEVAVHRAEGLHCSSMKSFVTKYYVAIHFGDSKVTTSPATSTSPMWNTTKSITGVGQILSIVVYQKKSLLLRIDRKLVGSIDIALSERQLYVEDTWFTLPEGQILLSIHESSNHAQM